MKIYGFILTPDDDFAIAILVTSETNTLVTSGLIQLALDSAQRQNCQGFRPIFIFVLTLSTMLKEEN